METGGRSRRAVVKFKIEYYLAKTVGMAARGLSQKTAYFIGDRLGDIFFYLVRKRRDVAFANLKRVFGSEKTDKELMRIVHLNYRHFGRTLMEFARIPVLTKENILQEIPVHNREILEKALSRNRGVLVLSGHFGNWEYLAATIAQIGPPLYAVFKEQKNLLVDDLIKQQRISLGLLPLKVKGGAARGTLMALKTGAKVLILFDQDAGGKGIFVEFLGTPASTTDGPAKIAIRHGVPAVMAISYRTKKRGIEVVLEEFPSPEQFSNDQAGIIEFIKEYNKRLERYIRKYPEQWFWMHRRWLTWERHKEKEQSNHI